MGLKLVICGICRDKVRETDFIRHDILCHDGYRRVQESHQIFCEPSGWCICRWADYQAIQEELRPLPSSIDPSPPTSPA